MKRRGLTLVELLVSIGLLMVLGTLVVGYLRSAMNMQRTGIARGRVYEDTQAVMRLAADDLAQVEGMPAHADGSRGELSFLVQRDPFGRQIVCFTRSFGEELSSLAGYDAGRGASRQGFDQRFRGMNVRDQLLPTGGTIEVCYLFEPVAFSTRLYRGVCAPAGAGGLIDEIGEYLEAFPSETPESIGPALWWQQRGFRDKFQLVSENALAFNLECWDEQTTTWDMGNAPLNPRTDWSVSRRLALGRPPLPYSVRLTVIIQADDPIMAETEALGEHGESDSYIRVSDTRNFGEPGTPNAFLRINGELIAYGGMSGSGFTSCVRGVLGTRAQRHPEGSIVRGGEGFQRVFQLPVSR